MNLHLSLLVSHFWVDGPLLPENLTKIEFLVFLRKLSSFCMFPLSVNTSSLCPVERAWGIGFTFDLFISLHWLSLHSHIQHKYSWLWGQKSTKPSIALSVFSHCLPHFCRWFHSCPPPLLSSGVWELPFVKETDCTLPPWLLLIA